MVLLVPPSKIMDCDRTHLLYIYFQKWLIWLEMGQLPQKLGGLQATYFLVFWSSDQFCYQSTGGKFQLIFMNIGVGLLIRLRTIPLFKRFFNSYTKSGYAGNQLFEITCFWNTLVLYIFVCSAPRYANIIIFIFTFRQCTYFSRVSLWVLLISQVYIYLDNSSWLRVVYEMMIIHWNNFYLIN